MEFYEKLQQLRKENGFSQEELANQLNVSRQAVSKWENGQGYPETDKLLQMSNIYGVSVDYLLKDEQPQTPEGEPDDGSYYASREMVDSFLLSRRQRALQIAIGVAVLILSFSWMAVLPDGTDTIMFFLTAAVGVLVLVMNGFRTKRYAPELETKPLMFDHTFINELRNRYQSVRRNCGIMISGGILSIILGVVTQIFFDEIRPLPGERGDVVLFILVALGVALIILGSSSLSAWGLVADNEAYVKSYRNDKMYGWIYGITMTLATVVFLYAGFTTRNWHPGWLAFPVGVLVGRLVVGILQYARK